MTLLLLLTVCIHAAVGLTKLTVEGRVEPLGLDETEPRFGWQIVADKKMVMQEGYQLQVSTTPEDNGYVWDSGYVKSDSSQWVSYKGSTLKPNTVYYWRVKIKTNRGKSGWSEWSKWTTGLLAEENWLGQWIGYDSITPDVRMEQHSRIAARHLRKTFSVQKPVKRATAHICGLGYYLLHINGRRIGDYLLAPAPTQYDKAVIYDTYDVTNQCTNNAPCIIDVTLAGGYFFPMTQNYQTNVRSAYGMPKLRMNLIVEYEDGTSETIATDDTWQIAFDGPVRYANIYDGTLVDYNCQPTAWMPVQVVEAPCPLLRGNSIGGVKAYKTEESISCKPGGKGKYILDFGTNNTGRIFLPSVTIGSGDTVSVRYAETLKADGTLYTDNLRSAQSTDFFVGNGKAVDMTTEFLDSDTWR